MSAGLDPRVGAVLGGRFHLEERLGQGGFGAVYRATHVATGGDVAIKVLRADLAGSETTLQRFYREARNTHRLAHPNTVRVSDFGEADDGALYIVMEYVAGRPLSAVLEAGVPLSTARALRIARQILKSLGEAHALGVIHRDIKPDNIMLVDQFGEPDFVKVLDFGISRSVGSAATTTAGGFIGTPRYMAPEQWLSMPVGPRTDLYAVGLILFQMLAGRLPFAVDEGGGGQAALVMMAAHCTRERLTLRELVPHTDPVLSKLVARLIAADPEARPPDVEAVLKELARVDGAFIEEPGPQLERHGAPPPAAALPTNADLATLEPVFPAAPAPLRTSDADTPLVGNRPWPNTARAGGRWALVLAALVLALVVAALVSRQWGDAGTTSDAGVSRASPALGGTGADGGDVARIGGDVAPRDPVDPPTSRPASSAPHRVTPAVVAPNAIAALAAPHAEAPPLHRPAVVATSATGLDVVPAGAAAPALPATVVLPVVASRPSEPYAPRREARPEAHGFAARVRVLSQPPGAMVWIREDGAGTAQRTPTVLKLSEAHVARLLTGASLTVVARLAGRSETQRGLRLDDLGGDGLTVVLRPLPRGPQLPPMRVP